MSVMDDFSWADDLANKNDEAQLVALKKRCDKRRRFASTSFLCLFLALVLGSLVWSTVTVYIGPDFALVLQWCTGLGLAVSYVLSDHLGKKASRIELALKLKRRAITKTDESSCCDTPPKGSG